MDQRHEVWVKPYGDGWKVECDDVCQPIVFLAQGRAEQHGRALAGAMARADYNVRMLVCDREGAVIAVGRYFAVEPEGVWLAIT